MRTRTERQHWEFKLAPIANGVALADVRRAGRHYFIADLPAEVRQFLRVTDDGRIDCFDSVEAAKEYVKVGAWNSEDIEVKVPVGPRDPKARHERETRNLQRIINRYGADTVGEMYRLIYKYGDCGASVGAYIEGRDRPVYCSDLYRLPADAHVVALIVSSIVEALSTNRLSCEV